MYFSQEQVTTDNSRKSKSKKEWKTAIKELDQYFHALEIFINCCTVSYSEIKKLRALYNIVHLCSLISQQRSKQKIFQKFESRELK